jgi:hypothetical protein
MADAFFDQYFTALDTVEPSKIDPVDFKLEIQTKQQYGEMQASLVSQRLYHQQHHDLIKQRKYWSVWTLCVLVATASVYIVVILAICWGCISINSNILTLLLTGIPVEILGLAFIIVKFLFHESSLMENPSKK